MLLDCYLLENIFHITSEKSWLKIIEEGYIKCNPEINTFVNNSPNSFAKKQNWVCCFDFRRKAKDHVAQTFEDCLLELLTIRTQKPVVLIIKKEIHKDLIFQSEFTQETGLLCSKDLNLSERCSIGGLYVHYTECWSNQPIPVSAIEKTVKVYELSKQYEQ